MWQKQSPGYAETEFPAPRFKVVLSSRTQAEASPLPPPLTSTEALQSKDSGQLCQSPPRVPQGGLFVGVQTPQSCLQPSGRYHAHHGQSSFQAPRGGRGRWTCLPGIAGELKTAHLWGQVPALQLKRSAFGQIPLSLVLPLSSSPHRVDSRQ